MSIIFPFQATTCSSSFNQPPHSLADENLHFCTCSELLPKGNQLAVSWSLSIPSRMDPRSQLTEACSPVREVLPKLGAPQRPGPLLELLEMPWFHYSKTNHLFEQKALKLRGQRGWRLQISVNYILSTPRMPVKIEPTTATRSQCLTPKVPKTLHKNIHRNKQTVGKLFLRENASIIFLSFSKEFQNW